MMYPCDDMMHLLRKYDVFGYAENDAMFANSLGEADIIHEVNIISEASSFAARQTSLKNLLEKSQGVFSGSPNWAYTVGALLFARRTSL